MCGIAGTVGLALGGGRIQQMLARMEHRGPEGEGVWNDGQTAEFGHRRLAIIDLATGQQPQVSPDGRYVLILNGEIYNYTELRPPLEQLGWKFRTTSDTEVLLAGLILKGADFIRETIGMFAFALWDNREKSLLLARDRMGIKPLYYAEPSAGKLVFASDLRAVLASGEVPRRLDAAALESYLALRYVPGPRTMAEGVSKFPPGHWAVHRDGKLTFKKYWEVRFDSSGADFAISDEEAEERFAGLLEDAVRLCLRADVPCGAFLSGGVDSSVVTALMSRLSPHPVRTYSIGFGTPQDELSDAERTAKRLGTIHTSFEMKPSDFSRLPELVRMLDEPFADPIALAMYLLAEKAKKDVKVILTGEGADEILAGYVHHPHFLTAQNTLGYAPNFLLQTAALGVKLLPVSLLDRAFAYPASMGRKGRERLAGFLSVMKRPSDRYGAYVALFQGPEREAVLRPGLTGRWTAPALASGRLDAIFDLEYRTWLADNILFKQDKTLMAHSVEGRVPFCDHRLVEFAARLPMRFKLGGGQNKRILRTAARKLLPADARPAAKKAFMIPVDGPCGQAQKAMARDVLTSSTCTRRGIFNPDAVEKILDDCTDSPLLAGKQLMSLMMFELWMENVFDEPSAG